MSIAIKDLKVGILYWESTQYGNFQFKVLRQPYRVDTGWACVVEYKPNDPRTIFERDGWNLGIYDSPAYTGVKTVYYER